MVLLDQEQACFIDLLKASLFDLTPVIPDRVNWEKIFSIAKAQCVVPLIATYVPAEHKNDWRNTAFQSRAHYIQLIYEQNSLVDLLRANQIPFVIIKGTAAAIYYPNPSLRSFGDVDFYVSDKYWETSMNLLKNNGYIFLSNNVRQFEFEKNGIDFELHSKFSSKNYNDIEHLLINGLNNSVEYNIGGNSFPGLPRYENGLVLLGHIMQHLKDSGIGLRQIIDWMMFVNKELDDTAWSEVFRSLAHEAGLEKLAITVTYMCKKWLGLPNEITWCNLADEYVADQLLLQVLEDGNLGKERAPFESIKKSMKSEGVFRYLQREGLTNWPLAQKCVLFKPFAWLYQFCRYICIGIGSLFTGKKVFRNRKQELSLEKLLKKLE